MIKSSTDNQLRDFIKDKNTQRIGRVLWWDSQHNEGRILDLDKNQWYFDKQAIMQDPEDLRKLVKGSIVLFYESTKDYAEDYFCATDVQLFPYKIKLII